MGKFSISRPVTVTMLTIFYVALGIGSYMFLTRDLFPNINKPALKIITEFEGASSKDIEEQITKKIEEQLGSVKGVLNMKSYSGEEKSEIILEFGFGTNLDFASIDIREKLDQIQSQLPDDSKSPLIERFDPGAQAIIIASVSTENKELEKNLREELEESVKILLERIPGVASVQLSGGNLYEIRIEVDSAKLKAYKVSLRDIEKALKVENVSMRGGRLSRAHTEFLVRTVGKLNSIESLKDTVIRSGEGIIYLKDVLSYKRRNKRILRDDKGNFQLSIGKIYKQRDTKARLKTSLQVEPVENIQISIFKKPGTNTLKIAKNIKAILINYEKKEKQDKKNINVVITYDQSIYISQSLDNIKTSAVQGIILAVIILIIFLRNIESTIIIAVSMPISVVAAFALFPSVSMGLNLFSMAGLTLAVGMVVDNAIVVIEAIFANLKTEKRLDKAIIVSITEVGPPVFSSTLTTLAVFVPILFVKGLVGQIFRDLSYTIVFTLIFSLIVAFTFIPMLIYRFVGSSTKSLKLLNVMLDKFMGMLFNGFGKLFLKLYDTMMKGIMSTWITRFIVILSVAALFVLSLLNMPASELLPETPEANVALNVGLPSSLNLKTSNKIARNIEQVLYKDKNLKSEILQFTSRISTKELNFLIKLKKADPFVIALIRKKIRRVPDIKAFTLTSVSPLKTILSSEKGDIGIKISGQDLIKLNSICRSIVRILKRDSKISKYLTDIRNSMGEGKKEKIIRVNKNNASDLKISTENIAKNVEMSLSGKKVTNMTLSGEKRQLDVILSLELKTLKDSDLRSLPLKNRDGKTVNLGDVAKIEDDVSPALILREERERVAIISANIKKSAYKAGITLGIISNLLLNKTKTGLLDKKIRIPLGYSIKLIGTSETMQKSFSSLIFALVAAIVLVYMVMASQFESLLHPFAIMFSIPLSIIGAFAGLLILDINLSITAFIGLIMLAGIVVNNAIILIDYINILRARGYDRDEAILFAGQSRMRPIFMTTLTTVLGMLPMALGIGAGAALYQPLAIVVIGGLSFATFLTLVFIPTIYCFFDDVKELIDFIAFKVSMLFERS